MSAVRKAMRRALPGLLGGLMLMSGLAHAGTVTYVYTDPQGTPLAEADASGNITATFDYAPYGSQALGTPPSGPGYTGHVNDPESGLVYMQARYYDPAVGRFISADPIGPGAGNPFNFNRYAYADNSPIVHDDPTGAYSLPVSDDDRYRGASDTGIEGNNAEDDGSAGLTNRGGGADNKVQPTAGQIKSMESLKYKDVKVGDPTMENTFLMDDQGRISGKSQDGCIGGDVCRRPADTITPGTTLFGHTHVYPQVATGAFRSRSNELRREFPGPGDANPLKQHLVSGIVMPSGARYIISGNPVSPTVTYLGGGDSRFGHYVTEKWHPGISSEEIEHDVDAFLRGK